MFVPPTGHILVHCRRSFHCAGCGCRYWRGYTCRVRMRPEDGFLAVERAVHRVQNGEPKKLDDLPCPVCLRCSFPAQFERVKDCLVVLNFCNPVVVASLFLAWLLQSLNADLGILTLIVVWCVNLLLLGCLGWCARRRPRDATQRDFRRSLRRDRLIVEPEETWESLPPPNTRLAATWRWMAFGLLAMAAGPVAIVASGINWNADITPAIVGPGETFELRFRTEEYSAGGRWQGSALFRIEEPEELQGIETIGTGRGGTLETPKGTESPRAIGALPFRIRMPDDTRLRGREIVAAAEARISFPDSATRANTKREYRRTVRIAVADRGEQSNWLALWWSTFGLGAAAMLATPWLALRAWWKLKRLEYWPRFELVDTTLEPT